MPSGAGSAAVPMKVPVLISEMSIALTAPTVSFSLSGKVTVGPSRVAIETLAASTAAMVPRMRVGVGAGAVCASATAATQTTSAASDAVRNNMASLPHWRRSRRLRTHS